MEDPLPAQVHHRSFNNRALALVLLCLFVLAFSFYSQISPSFQAETHLKKLTLSLLQAPRSMFLGAMTVYVEKSGDLGVLPPRTWKIIYNKAFQSPHLYFWRVPIWYQSGYL